MKKILFSFLAWMCCYATIAQLPEDVLRYSYFPNHGTARNLATGGAMGSLGGDISAMYVNPAGLGLFKTSEFVISPGAILNNNKFNFRGTNSSSSKSGFDLGTTGFVFGFNTPRSKWTNQAFSIGINQVTNFNNVQSYRGTNNLSSYSEVFSEEISRSGKSIDDVLNDQRYAFGSSPALYTYLVDTFRHPTRGLEVRALPEFLLENGIALNQERRSVTSGGIYEIGLAYAANMDDRLYLGAGLGIPIVNYQRNNFFRESDPSGDNNNNFNFFEYNNRLSTKGVGVNAKLGLIYKPSEFVRLGLALHTPTFYSLTDRESADLSANTEAYNSNKTATANSEIFTNNRQAETKYGAVTPWKAIISGSYVFREINDTRRQRAFVTADIEYVGYPNASFQDDSETGTNLTYYNELKTVIRDYYRGAFNYRLGGELKFHTWMVRAGAAYYGNPYQDNANLKANRFIASGGLGYRNYGMFVDLTYAHTFNRDVNFPYRLQDKANTFAEQTGSIGNIMLTVGFKL